MSTSSNRKSNRKLVPLEVRSGDQGSEILVIDSEFQLAARGVGQIKAELKPGIYTVRVQVGSEATDEYVVLRDKAVVKELAPLAFTSPIPLAQTAKTHEYHEAAALNEFNKQHVKMGTGSAIFVFARDWRGANTPQAQGLHPARGLTLRHTNGSPMVSFEEASTSDLQAADPWAACNVELDPGAYILRLTLVSGQHLEQTVVASPGWQTQVFLLQCSYGQDVDPAGGVRPEDRQADMANASILLARYPSPSALIPDEKRLAELARIGLAERRRALSDEMRSTLRGEFEDPMLGMLCGNLLLLESEPDLDLLTNIVENLRRLLGKGTHLDVEALALALEREDTTYIFDMPPMLRDSWWRIVSATVTQPEIVPVNSFAASVSRSLRATDLWNQWFVPVRRPEESEGAVPFALTSMDAVTPPKTTTGMREAAPHPGGAAEAFALHSPEVAEEAIGEAQGPAVDEEYVADLVRVQGLPRSVLEATGQDLSRPE